MLKSSVLFNFLAELVAPWFAFYPRTARAHRRRDHGAVAVCADLQWQPFLFDLAYHRFRAS
jgi:hypothetical protein